MTCWFELISPLRGQVHELLLLQSHETSIAEDHVTHELPLLKMAVVHVASEAT